MDGDWVTDIRAKGVFVGTLIQGASKPKTEVLANVAIITAAPVLFAALNNLQANPNDPRAHRQALDAIKLARGAL